METSSQCGTGAARVPDSSGGVNESYQAARTSVALFDLEQEGRFRISGLGHLDALNRIVTVDLRRMNPYHGMVGLFLRPDATFVAIGVIFRGVDHAFVFTEPETADGLRQYLLETTQGEEVLVQDLRATHGLLSLVGPMALEAAVDAAGDDILGMGYLTFEDDLDLDGQVFRFGFSGEYEYRFLVAKDAVPAAFDRIMTEAKSYGLVKGDPSVLPLLMFEVRSFQFADIPATVNVLEAGMHWMIDFAKPDLVAGPELAGMKDAISRRGLMVSLQHDGLAQPGDRLSIEGQDVGQLARLAHSPTRRSDIGLAYVDSSIACVGVAFDIEGARGWTVARGISGPTILTRSVATPAAES